MDIQETNLPGVGLRHDFTTRGGRQLEVVSYRTGRRDLLLYDPDACRQVIRLTQKEADALARPAWRRPPHRAPGRIATADRGPGDSWLIIQGRLAL